VLGTELQGDPASLYALGDWLKRVGETLEATAASVRRAADETELSWHDDAGELYLSKLRPVLPQVYSLQERVAKLEGLVHDCGDGLSHAQGVMAEAEDLAVRGALVVENHRIILPSRDPRQIGPPDGPEEMKHLYDGRVIEELYQEKLRTYDHAQELVEQACQTVVDLCERLDRSKKIEWDGRIIAAGTTTFAEIEPLAKLSESRLRVWHTGALRRADLADYSAELWSKDALRTGSWGPVDRAFAWKADEQLWAMALRHTAESRAGVARLVARGAPLLAIGEIAYNIAKGQPADKAILTTGVSTAVGSTGAAIGFFIAGEVGMIVGVLVGGLLGLIAGELTGDLYDQHVESAQSKLARWSAEGVSSLPATIDQPEPR
jgi:hypothetical protein